MDSLLSRGREKAEEKSSSSCSVKAAEYKRCHGDQKHLVGTFSVWMVAVEEEFTSMVTFATEHSKFPAELSIDTIWSVRFRIMVGIERNSRII
ncbi:hypothetical protein CEXT_17731 [Caerostris extrusa]|uniref:Uncharacterized protein n=1 Tax=Caerostris extrusa TaxID=172846 RepID=A0AAV4XVE6_CAEEX|nr:hypothetical protein CEXT_17731 [Caerostris extrusa]